MIADLIVVWVAAIIIAGGFFLTSSISVHTGSWEEPVVGCLLPIAIIIAAIVLTILRVHGAIGPFFGSY